MPGYTQPTPPSLSWGENFDALLEFLREPELGPTLLSPNRFTKAFGMDLKTLARQARVHRNTVSQSPGSESVQQFIRNVLRVLRAAIDVSGDVGRATFWYRNEPLPPFDYKTAEALVSEGRTEEVLRYVVSLNAGAAG